MGSDKGLVQLSQLTAANYKLGRALLDEAGDALAACLSLTPTAENVHQILACCEFLLSGWNNLKANEENSTLKGVVIESDSLGTKEGEDLHSKRPDMDIKFPGFMHGFNWKKQ